MKVKLIEVGSYYKDTLNNKWLLEGKKDIDYASYNYIGKIIVTEKGERIGKILDIIGNVNKPYILVEPLTERKPIGEKLFVEIVERRKGGRRK